MNTHLPRRSPKASKKHCKNCLVVWVAAFALFGMDVVSVGQQTDSQANDSSYARIEKLIAQDNLDEAVTEVEREINRHPGDPKLKDILTYLTTARNARITDRSPEAQLTFETLLQMAKIAEASEQPQERSKRLRQFLDHSSAFLKEHPEEQQLWLLRAAAAIELRLPKTGWEAGQKLRKLGALEQRDAKMRTVLTTLNLRGWLGTNPPPPSATEPWINSLGMKFARIGNVNFAMYETRVQDYATFVQATGYDAGERWKKPGFDQSPNHPVVHINWNDAQAFCKWLTEKEHKESLLPPTSNYRLPDQTDWNRASNTGIEASDVDSVPGLADDYNIENISGTWTAAQGNRHDTFRQTAPVGSFPPNSRGIFDLGANVLEWSEETFGDRGQDRKLRGTSWKYSTGDVRHQIRRSPRDRADDHGFRVVIALPEGEFTASTYQSEDNPSRLRSSPAISQNFAPNSCCAKAKAVGKECEHKCCVSARLTGAICKKCNG